MSQSSTPIVGRAIPVASVAPSQQPVFRYNDFVESPLGRCTIEGIFLPPRGESLPSSPNIWPDQITRYIVRFSRKDFDPEIWKTGFSVFNGPSVSRTFRSDELVLIEAAPKNQQEAAQKQSQRRSQSARQSAAQASSLDSSSKTRYSGKIEVGQVWVSNKGGYRYRLIKVDEAKELISFEWVDDPKYKQHDKPFATLVSRYTLEMQSPDEVLFEDPGLDMQNVETEPLGESEEANED